MYWLFAGQLRRAKRLNVIGIADPLDDEDVDFSNCQQYIAPSDKSHAIEDEGGRFHNKGIQIFSTYFFSSLI
jgi:hypothetical protein